MPVFEYKAVSSSGKNVKGVIDAPNSSEARSRLRRDGVFLTEIKESSLAESPQAPGNIQFTRGVSLQDVTIMTRQLATLIASSVPVVDSLTALVDQIDNVRLKRAIADVKEKVNEGSSMADAMKAHPKIFNDLTINMVRAGEASGALDIVLNRLADFNESQARLKGKVVAALAYPIVMLIIGVLALVILFTFVIPKVVEIYQDLGQALPLPTQVLITISNIFVSYWYIVFGVSAITFFALRAYIKTPKGKRRYHAFLLRLPIFGVMFRMVAIARFANTLGTLLASGVPILKAMDIVKNIVANEVLTEVLETVRNNVSEGDSIAEPLKRSGEFPPLVTHMIAIGEKTGEVESMLAKVSETYNNMVDSRVSTMTSLLEPIMIVVMAGVIGFVVFSVMLPIFQMSQTIS